MGGILNHRDRFGNETARIEGTIVYPHIVFRDEDNIKEHIHKKKQLFSNLYNNDFFKLSAYMKN